MGKGVPVLIVAPLIGHLTSSLEMAKIMLERNKQLSVTSLIMKIPTDPEGTTKIRSLLAGYNNVERLNFHHLPTPEDTSSLWSATNRAGSLDQLIEYQKTQVRDIVSRIKGLNAFILDSITTTMIDVADEFGMPSYIFFTSGAAFLGVMLHFQALEDEGTTEMCDIFKKTKEIVSPSFANPIPISVLPSLVTNKETWSTGIIEYIRGYRKAKGIMVNSFCELETLAFNSFSMDLDYGKSRRLPPISLVGPIINKSQNETKNQSEIMEWLDGQPANSVVFLCFGSVGSFHSDQVKKIANGLEKCGYRFLWSLRHPPTEKEGFSGEYENQEHLLPKGFLDRTASIGKVVGWIPQFAVLSHSAVGGFVSHCGWNSTLESIWCGVPIATWPLFAEQQLNAFQLVKELGISVEISLDYNESNENQRTVSAEKVERAIRELMDGENVVRKKVKEISEKSKQAVKEGGSSYITFDNIIQSISSDSGNLHLVS
ncbi:hypothetical protein ACH5RR_028949 [Cinchona calisaya]|uniref:Glycosyltransferase n=1 Tax=Cinchona calisaya TaxID=153742 RepID=A0ABD2YQA6_9GENT